MNTSIDDDVLKALDFEVHLDDEEAKPCRGYIHRNAESGEILGVNNKCSNPAVLCAAWKCCGARYLLCLDCYNYMCRVSSAATAATKHSTCGNTIKAPIFLPDLEWL